LSFLPAPAIDTLDKAGKLRVGTRRDLARVGIGVAVRQGVPLPDVSTVDAVRTMLLEARSIVHPDPQGGGKVLIARVGVGVFVRRGDPKPDISTPDAFLRSVMNAKNISYSDPALGGTAANYVGRLLASLDITGSITPKTKLTAPSKPLADFVVNGGADFGLTQITEVLADPRLELVGPLPAEIQFYTDYAAGVMAASQHHDVGKALIAFLASPAASDVMKSKGFTQF